MDYRDAGLSDAEYAKIKELLGRTPNELETSLIGVMWSEHCSYKSTRGLLAAFPQQGKHVAQGPGENAGVVDCGSGWGLAFKVESHNHPSAVAPYQGAATGVGGIIRDILAMGARPVASMDGLFFGPPDSRGQVALASGIVEGIAGYGNAVGVATIGGRTFYDPCFEGNPLVNAFNCGYVRLDSIVSSKTARAGCLVVLLGSKTGRDGIAGASFASKELDENSRESRPQIQIGDPFEEKLLIECCLELHGRGLIASMQDMGAAGILSSSSEIAHKSGVGIEIFCERIPLREEMAPWEIFLSESQERMLLIVNPEKFEPVKAVAERFALECIVIGNIVEGDRYKVFKDGELIADLPHSILGDAPLLDWPSSEPADLAKRRETSVRMKSPDPARDLLKLIGAPHGRERGEIWEQYDCQVQLRTTEGPGAQVSAMTVPESDGLVTLSMEGDPWKCRTAPFTGAAETMAQSLRIQAVSGAEILGMTNCLNFPSPDNPENYYELSECVRGLAAVCADMECPVVSGNVSLYNETPRGGIYPTPLVVTAGLVPHFAYFVRCGCAKEGDVIYLVGPTNGSLGASRWQVLCCEPGAGQSAPRGVTWEYNPSMERDFAVRARTASRKAVVGSARVIAGGGVAVALAKEAIYSGLGMSANLGSLDMTAALFSEGGPRALYFVQPANAEKFSFIWDGYPLMSIGRVGGESLRIDGAIDIGLDELRAAFYFGGLLDFDPKRGERK
ncbi:MAG: phosphoribosylformylglycinamidine synthase subunit PurL [Synergistaceae bacterium]|jgi:phosphoribosylformylglycinamidine synthase|nr:phosphoribosylformylglycinamidine synthase subunit PurL [Synergistaceae bacterium]